MTDSTTIQAGAKKPAAPLLGMSIPSAMVVLLAVASVLVIASVQGGSIRINSPLSPSLARSATFTLGPHLLVIALFATGFPRTGGLGAIAVAFWIGGWATVMTLLSRDQGIATVVALQVVMLVVALVALSQGRDLPVTMVPARDRLLGLLGTITIGFAGYHMLAAPVAHEAERRATLSPANRAGELGYALEPSPLLPDSVRLVSNEWAYHSVAGRVMGFARCVEMFRGDSGGPYPRSLRDLRTWSVRDTASSFGCASKLTWSTEDSSLVFLAPSDGHVIRYTAPTGVIDPFRPGPFTLETEAIWDSAKSPHVATQPGVRNYLLDTAGKFHVTAEHRRVTMRDPELPPCNPPEDFREVAECGIAYPARQRWRALDLPFARVDIASEARVGVPVSPMLKFTPVTSRDSVAEVTIDWGDSNPPVLETLPTASERSYGTHHDWNRRAHHVYTTPGPKTLKLTITTRSEETYSAEGFYSVGPRQ